MVIPNAVRLYISLKQLFDTVGELPGPSLCTGSSGETQDLDYKHDMKCKIAIYFIHCTTLIECLQGCLKAPLSIMLLTTEAFSPSGSSASLRSIGPMTRYSPSLTPLPQHLNRFSLCSVPRICWMSQGPLNFSNFLLIFATSIIQSSTHLNKGLIRALSVLGEMFEALLKPFINPDFTLSQQIISLVKLAHIACALFLKHESDFMPRHLYSDLQCMVQTAIFRVAHTKILD